MTGLSQAPEGFLLLTLAGARVSAPFAQPPEQTGVLALECVTMPLARTDPQFYMNAAGTGQRDVWLVLKLNSFELLVSPTETIRHSRQHYTFLFKAPEGPVVVTLPSPANLSQKEDNESFEVLLSQYGIVQELDEPSSKGETGDNRDLKGRLVLVDEEDGNIVGTLGEGEFEIKEDASVGMSGKAPVVMDMPEEGQTKVKIRSANPEEQKEIFETAEYVSRGIVYATDTISKGMGMASDFYVNHTSPQPKPLVFSDTSRQNIKRIHKVSAQAVKVSSSTTGMIHKLLDKAVDKVSGATQSVAQPHQSAAYAPSQSGAMPAIPTSEKGKSSATSGHLPPPYAATSGTSSPAPAAPAAPGPKRRLLNRLLMSTDLILTTLESSAQTLITNTTENLATSLGHKYGGEMAGAVRTVGSAVRNVGVVYIDYRGVGRRVLIKRVGKRIIKGKIGQQQVVFGEEGVSETVSQQQATAPNYEARGGSSSNVPSTGSGRWKFRGPEEASGVPGGFAVGTVPYKSE